jgi:FOG: Ankyrin repeat
MDQEKVQSLISEIYSCYNRRGDDTPMEETIEEVRALYKSFEDTDAEYNRYPILFFATERGDHVGVEVLLELGADASFVTEYGYTPLHRYAYADYRDLVPWVDEEKLVSILLDAGTSVIRKDTDEATSVFIAANKGKYKFLQTALAAGKKLDIACKNGETALHTACDRAVRTAEHFFVYVKPEHEKTMAKELNGTAEDRITEERKITSQETYDREWGEVNACFEVVKCLLEAGLDPDQKDNYGKTAKEIAFECKDARIAALLNGTYKEEAGDGSNDLQMKAKGMSLMQATELKDYEAVAALLELGEDPNELSADDKRYGNYINTSVEGKTPLAVACMLMDLELITALLQHGANPNLKDADGKIALLYGLRPMVSTDKLLKEKVIDTILAQMIEKGLDINQEVDEEGNTLFNAVCEDVRSTGGRSVPERLFQLLLKNKVDVNIANNDAVTPLMYICSGEDSDMENLQISLLEANADITAKDENGNTPLMYAAKNNKFALAKNLADMLFTFGDPQMDAVNNEGKSALEFATEKDNENLVNYLLTKM